MRRTFYSILTLGATAAVLAAFTGLCLADDIIVPRGGQWGDVSSTTESILKMNRDPMAVRHEDADRDSVRIQGICTDSNGRTFQSDDTEYAPCMNEKIKRAQQK